MGSLTKTIDQYNNRVWFSFLSLQHVICYRLRSVTKWLMMNYKYSYKNSDSCGAMGGAPRVNYAVKKAEPRSNCLSIWALPGGPPHATLHVPLALAPPNVIPNLQGEPPP